MAYDYKDVDWKTVKAEWDKFVWGFSLDILHQERRLSFQAQLDKGKRYRLMMYIDGVYKGTYSLKEHEYYKYHNIKAIRPSKKMVELHKALEKINRRLPKDQKMKIDATPRYFATPVYDNIAQIKKMVEALE